MNKDCSILILSCDKNVDLIHLFIQFFKKNWRDCEYDIFIGLEKADEKFSMGTILNSKETLWSKRLKEYLREINTEYVLIMLDDFIIEGSVNSTVINDALELINDDKDIINISFSKIANDGKIDTKIKYLCHRNNRGNYLLNYQIGLWRKSKFIELLKDDENPWQSELFGSIRARKFKSKKFYCLTDDKYMPIKFNRGWLVVQGCWNGNELKRLEETYNIKIPLGERPLAYSHLQDRAFIDRVQLRLNIIIKKMLSYLNIYFE